MEKDLTLTNLSLETSRHVTTVCDASQCVYIYIYTFLIMRMECKINSVEVRACIA